MSHNLKKDTILLHGGHEVDSSLSRAVPIFQTASYMFNDTDHAADLFALKEFGNIYTRLMNPTTDVLEKRVAALEGAAGALGVASGQSAISLAMLNIAQAGDEIISSSAVYGGTYTLFCYTLKKMGITVKFVDPDDPENFRKAITSKTKAIFSESIGNPRLNVTDLEAVSTIAHENHLPFILDNTTTPYILQPIKHGVDIVVYSATKFLGGHGTSIGGMIVDSGNFDWTIKEQGVYKFPLIAGPDPAYHNLDFVEALKPMGNIAYIIKARVVLLRDLGPALSPFNSFLFLQGLETLHLRMPRHTSNARKVAEFLESHEKVAWVNYPGLESSPEKGKTEKYLGGQGGAVIGFGIKGGKEGGIRFINNVKLLSHLANIGDAKSLVIHPASTTHQQLSPEEQIKSGVTEDFIRLSVGIEDPGDIIADIDQALKA